MPSFVNPEKCDGCKALDKTACQYICPNDLMVLDKEKMKAYNRDPTMCWECYNCVKICPTQAVDVRGYADFVPMGASVAPAALHRLHHVDGQVPQRHAQALQVPDPDHSGRPGGAGRWLGDRGRASTDPTLFTEPASARPARSLHAGRSRRRNDHGQTSKLSRSKPTS